MSLSTFDMYLIFAERAVNSKSTLPPSVDPTDFENALVSYGIVLLHSHMEQCLKKAIDSRCNRCTDVEIRAFALSVRDEKTGKIGIDALKGTLARFGDATKSAFKNHLDSSGLGSSWESVKNQRIRVAHYGEPAACTLADLRLYYEEVKKILGFYCVSLGLSKTEVSGISNLIICP